MSFIREFRRPELSTGLPYMVLAALFFSLMTLFVKIAGQRLPSMEIVLTRGIVTLGYSYAALRWAGISPWGRNRVLLVLRGLFGFLALTCLYYAVTKLPLADANVIQYTNPVFTTILAAIFLKERIAGADLMGAVLGVSGVVLVARPAFLFGASVNPLDMHAAGIALLGAMCSAAAYVVVRRLRNDEPSAVIIFYFPLVTTIASLPLALPSFIWPTLTEWLIIIFGVGLCAQLGQICLTLGLKIEPAGRAMALSYLQVVFAAIWGVIFLTEHPSPLTVAGSLLVFGGTWITVRTGHGPRVSQEDRAEV